MQVACMVKSLRLTSWGRGGEDAASICGDGTSVTTGQRESGLYVAIGSFVRAACPHSVDQQLPSFLRPYLNCSSGAEGRGGEGEEEGDVDVMEWVRVVLVDPRFAGRDLHECVPLAVQLDPDGWEVWNDDHDEWESVHTLMAPSASSSTPSSSSSSTSSSASVPFPHSYRKGRVLMGVIPGFVEYTNGGQRDQWLRCAATKSDASRSDQAETSRTGGASLLDHLHGHARAVLKRGRRVWIGVFCQPYYVNEDSLAAIDLYHTLVDKFETEAGADRASSPVQAFILADYATAEHGTRVWHLNGKKHDQDLAVIKEVARFRGPGSNVSVPEYVFMRQQYGIGQRFTAGRGHTDVIAQMQEDIERAIVEAGGAEVVLAIDEDDLSSLSCPM